MHAPGDEHGGVHLRVWHGHGEWVHDLRWAAAIGSFISCSSDPIASMIIGEPIELIRAPPQSLVVGAIVTVSVFVRLCFCEALFSLSLFL